jgi:ABC transporter family protein
VCSGLTKDYGQSHGIFELDLAIDRGETFGFIGPNGAGKTTTIRLLMDLIRHTRGRAAVLGMDTVRDSLAIKRRVGYLPGELAGFPGVTASYVISLLAGLRGGVDPGRISALAERFQIDLGRRYETCRTVTSRRSGSSRPYQEPCADFCTRRESPEQKQAWLERQLQKLHPGCAITVTISPPEAALPAGT